MRAFKENRTKSDWGASMYVVAREHKLKGWEWAGILWHPREVAVFWRR